MMAVRERLEQVVARLTPGGGGFWAWWKASLVSGLPARWQALLGLSDTRLLLARSEEGMRIWYAQGASRVLLAETTSSLQPTAMDASLPARDRMLPRFALLSAGSALRRSLRLPAAAEAHLRDALRFEIDRQTPFSAEQVYYDARVMQRHAGGQIEVELVVAPRHAVETLLVPREAWQGQLDGVDVVDASGQTLGVNLLPASQRRRQTYPLRNLDRLLLFTAMVFLVLAGWQLLDNRRQAAARLAAQVEASAARARVVAGQRQQLQDLLDGHAFFAAQRAQQATRTRIINELSHRLGDDTSLEKLSIEEDRMQLIGMSGSASSLVAGLDGSPLWKTPTLTGVLQAGPRGGRERFTLAAELRVADPEAADGAAARSP
ncbi:MULTISPECIES: PilN domain-containing protein [Stenotrophomonas]|uniref:PilN domain-containing protein n=1 Tax=Stenotrophomonas TaxID=40323 RepID=UPI001CF1257F|nr:MULTISPECIES: PilN domain-containing protein [Stenotrophomonas]MCA7024587.1 PilN domain-containing protein [Stenotrophomonas acidaminiphila]MCE4073894.1 PilN domain-containing protein [Stenotrophomonas acidaminiphila]